MVVSNFFQGTALIGTTRIPDSGDVCSPSGKGFVMAINPFTGGPCRSRSSTWTAVVVPVPETP
jgi:Tfp pilus tip-associated adhesin PilY1